LKDKSTNTKAVLPSTPKDWRPYRGEHYWIVSDNMSVIRMTNTDSETDEQYKECGNCFKYEHEAYRVLSYVKPFFNHKK
jgi:hypothetical protein